MKFKNYPYIIAEIGANHNGDIDLAKKLIDKAKEAGCDAVKLQLLKREDVWTNDHLKELDAGIVKLKHVGKWETKELGLNSIFDQVESFYMPHEGHIELFRYASDEGIDFGSTVHVKESVDFLINQHVRFIKVASPDLTNLDLIEYIISKDYPVMISTGLASIGEIEAVTNLIPKQCKHNVSLLHCVSIYPADYDSLNLKFIDTLKELFGFNVGYSDHALGISSVLGAICFGANIIEKHFTLNRQMPGWDHCISSDPKEMKIICEESKKVFKAMGKSIKDISQEELENRFKFRKSVVVNKDLTKNNIIKKEDIIFKRPGTGIRADQFKYIIGRKINKDIKKDTTLYWDDIE